MNWYEKFLNWTFVDESEYEIIEIVNNEITIKENSNYGDYYKFELIKNELFIDKEKEINIFFIKEKLKENGEEKYIDYTYYSYFELENKYLYSIEYMIKEDDYGFLDYDNCYLYKIEDFDDDEINKEMFQKYNINEIIYNSYLEIENINNKKIKRLLDPEAKIKSSKDIYDFIKFFNK